jgi:hypothetical protein
MAAGLNRAELRHSPPSGPPPANHNTEVGVAMQTPGMYQTKTQAAKAFVALLLLTVLDLALAAVLIWAIYTIVGRIPR